MRSGVSLYLFCQKAKKDAASPPNPRKQQQTYQPESAHFRSSLTQLVKKIKQHNIEGFLNVQLSKGTIMLLAYVIFSAALFAFAVDLATEE